jgi:hypothetical protein
LAPIILVHQWIPAARLARKIQRQKGRAIQLPAISLFHEILRLLRGMKGQNNGPRAKLKPGHGRMANG